MRKTTFIAEERLNTLVANEKLNNLSGVNKEEKPMFTLLSLTAKSQKHNWPVGVPFPAVVKKSLEGLAVYNCVDGRKEIIPATSYKEPSATGESFEYKGYRYVKRDTLNGMPRYMGEKKPLI